MVTGGRSTGGRGPPTVLEFLVINFSVCLVLVLRKWRGPGWLRYASVHNARIGACDLHRKQSDWNTRIFRGIGLRVFRTGVQFSSVYVL